MVDAFQSSGSKCPIQQMQRDKRAEPQRLKLNPGLSISLAAISIDKGDEVTSTGRLPVSAIPYLWTKNGGQEHASNDLPAGKGCTMITFVLLRL